MLRQRAGLSDITFSSQQEALNKIYHERRIELFTEFGFRWLDLKRTQTIDSIMPSIATDKGGSWQTTDQLYPIPLSEIQTAPNIIQNPGYNYARGVIEKLLTRDCNILS